MTTLSPSWSDLAAELEEALLALPADGLLELLVRDVALTVTWLLPDRLLLELSGAPPSAGPSLRDRGWDGAHARRACVCGHGRAATAAAAAREAVLVLGDVLAVDPGDVELWRPRVEPPQAWLTWPQQQDAPW